MPVDANRTIPLQGLGLLLLALVLSGPAPAGEARNHSGVILVYHHVSADTPPSTSVTPERFARHLQHLEDNDFNVWPVERLLSHVEAGREIPERTVAITFDDAYASVRSEAMPMLEARGWPFSVFVSTRYIDQGLDGYLTWDQLRQMEARGVTMGNHTVSHGHLARPRPDESEDAWLERVAADINDAQERLQAELEDPARVFAWPYGESSPATEVLLRDLGYLGLGQHSGAVGPHSNLAAAPRFPIATGFDGLDSFALKVRTRALPVVATEPDSGVLAAEQDRPEVVLELADGAYRAGQINCYAGGRAITVERAGEEPLRLRVQADRPIAVGRTPYNCTAPASDANVWYWFSFLWMRPREDGSWYGW